MERESVERGRALLDQMTRGGAAAVEARWRELDPDLAELILGFVAGEIWSRPGLDRRLRSMVTVAITAALGRRSALELNLRLARNNGVTREEIAEVLFQVAAYAGFPACWEGMELVARVFDGEGMTE